MTKKRTYYNLYVGLLEQDDKRLAELAKQEGKSKTELAREAVRFYLDNRERITSNQKDTLLIRTVKGCFERAIAILARQNVEIGTLYELAWQNHELTGDEERFIAVVNNVKQRLRKKLVDDERQIADGMKKKITDKAS